MASGDSIHDRLEEDIVNLIQLLSLTSASGQTGNVGQNVIVLDELDKLALPTWPAVLVSVQGQAEDEDEGDFEDDWVYYPVLILICDTSRTGQAFRGAVKDYKLWRHAIAQSFRGLVNYPLLPDVPECFDVRVKNLPVLPDGFPLKDMIQSGLVAMCRTTEPRVRG